MSKILTYWIKLIDPNIKIDNPAETIKSLPFFSQRYIYCANALNYTDTDVLSDFVDFADEKLRHRLEYEKDVITGEVVDFCMNFEKTGKFKDMEKIIAKMRNF